MSAERSESNYEMLALARESRGMSQTEFATALNVTQGRVSKMEAGLLPMTDDILRRASEVLGYPENFFVQTARRSGLGPSEFYHYRKRKSVREKALTKWHAEFDIRRLNLTRLLDGAALDAPMEFPHFDVDEFGGDPTEIARVVRATWHIPRGPIRNVTRVVEDAGGIILLHDFESDQVDGISREMPDLPPIFLMNSQRNGARFRYSLSHEVGHIVMHRFPNTQMEEQADRFAAEFLMPAADIRSQLHDVTLAKLANLAPSWRVSLSALLKRACDLRMVSDRQQRALWKQMSYFGYRTHEPPELELPIEEPTLVTKLVTSHKTHLNYTPAALAQLLAFHPEEYARIYESPRKRLHLVRTGK
jgi:Zn-dependent peptidase ImmA (M78 family)/transcriptional regulator with XRE-family HTH domain